MQRGSTASEVHGRLGTAPKRMRRRMLGCPWSPLVAPSGDGQTRRQHVTLRQQLDFRFVRGNEQPPTAHGVYTYTPHSQQAPSIRAGRAAAIAHTARPGQSSWLVYYWNSTRGGHHVSSRRDRWWGGTLSEINAALSRRSAGHVSSVRRRCREHANCQSRQGRPFAVCRNLGKGGVRAPSTCTRERRGEWQGRDMLARAVRTLRHGMFAARTGAMPRPVGIGRYSNHPLGHTTVRWHWRVAVGEQERVFGGEMRPP